MSAANTRLDTLGDVSSHGGNLRVTCRCGHRGVIDASKANRWYLCHGWGTQLSWQVGTHLRCSQCNGRPIELRPTFEPVNAPNRFPHDEAGWKRLVRRLRD